MTMEKTNAIRIGLLFFVLLLGACASASRTSTESSAGLSSEKNQAAAEAYRNLGEAYLTSGNLIAALQELKKAETLNPDDHITQFDIGLVYYFQERYDHAIPHFEKAVQIKPDYAPAINSLGNVYAAKKEWDKAIEAYRKIIEDAFYGTPHFALSNMGLAYYHKQDYAQAEKYFLEALKMQPDFANALGGLGMTYIAMGKYPEGAARLEKALKKDPKSPSLHFELGKAYRGMGETAKAWNEFARVVELAPESPIAAESQKEMQKLR
jgi:type IV pilus biogenesis/stability protein PilW